MTNPAYQPGLLTVTNSLHRDSFNLARNAKYELEFRPALRLPGQLTHIMTIP